MASGGEEPARDGAAISADPAPGDDGGARFTISEDWAATLIGLGLLFLALLGVIGKGMVP
ncbi:MAG: hypothetical protein ABSG37_05060 [Candidatus Limnocylindrales bacterium]